MRIKMETDLEEFEDLVIDLPFGRSLEIQLGRRINDDPKIFPNEELPILRLQLSTTVQDESGDTFWCRALSPKEMGTNKKQLRSEWNRTDEE